MTLLAEPDYGTPARPGRMGVRVQIDGTAVSVPAGTSVMRAAALSGVEIPKLCATDSLEPFGSCRLCLVEIEGRKGTRPRARPRAARTWLSRPARLGCSGCAVGWSSSTPPITPATA